MIKLKISALSEPKEIITWMKNIQRKQALYVTKRLAEIAEISIKTNIMNTSKMPSGALADKFFKERLGEYTWGVGNIDLLNKEAPAWRHINFGSTAINANWQHVLPKGHWENGRWVEGDGLDDYFTIPKTPIQAHNYIEKTYADLNIAIAKVLKEGK